MAGVFDKLFSELVRRKRVRLEQTKAEVERQRWLNADPTGRRRKEAEYQLGLRPAREKALELFRRGKQKKQGKSPSPYITHTDAAFDDDELARFILGMIVECRSTWIAAAQWAEETSVLTLWVIKTGKDYDFPGQDYDAALDFAQAHSKGQWYWVEWVGHHGTEQPYILEEEARPGTARRIFG